MAMKNLALAAGLVLTSSGAGAAVLDFETLGSCSGGPGVTFTLSDTIDRCGTGDDWTGPGKVLAFKTADISSNGVNLIVEATFAAPVEFVSVDLGDTYDPQSNKLFDADRVFLEVFGKTGDLLERTFFQRTAEMGIFTTLSLTVSGIYSAKFGTDAGDFGFIAVDNFTYTPTPIPLPASLPLLLAGLGGLAVLRRRARD